MAIIDQELDYPDNNYEGGLGVDEKEPELKWAVAGHSAVPELFNWVSRKATEDIREIIDYIDKFESKRKLVPLSELRPVAGEEPDIIYVRDYSPAFSFSPLSTQSVMGSTQIKDPTVDVSVFWSMSDVENVDSEPTIDLDMDVTGEYDTPGDSIDSSSKQLDIPSQNHEIQEARFTFSLGIGDFNEDGWDDVRGRQMNLFLRRAPEDYESGRLQIHSVEVG